MAANWTAQQKKAIAEKGNLLVAAAAGAGKTAVLTARIVEKIREGTDVRALLVVTFTRAAAAEMKKRIAKALREAAQNEPDSRERLTEAAERVQDASISTVHAFCAQVLRRHFYEAELDPAFRVADEAESRILLEDALEALAEENAGHEDYDALCIALGGEEKALGAFRELYGFLQSQTEPLTWLHEAVARYDTDETQLASSGIARRCVESCDRELRAAIDEMQFARDNVAISYPEAAAFADNELSVLRGILLQKDYDALRGALGGMSFARLTGFPRGTAEEDKAEFKEARDRLKKCVSDQAKNFVRPLSEEAARMRELHGFLLTMEKCLSALEENYKQAKRARGVIDYGDMEHIALGLLSRAEIGEAYRKKFEYIFIDEYQDANRVQEALIGAIKREDNLFMVGDVKQSIYRFRQAEPALFMEKYKAPASFDGQVVDLNANFRSAAAVIDAVNSVFSRTMSLDFGGVEYDERASLVHGRNDTARGGAEFCLLQLNSDEELDTAEQEARYAAERIRSIMENESCPQADGSVRPYRYSDFAILHRSPKRVAERITRILASEGIPAYAELTGGYFEAVEVRVFINLLRVIDNRRQDIPLVSVMRSMIGGFTDGELSGLRLLDGKAENWLDLLQLAASGEDGLAKRSSAFLDKLDDWYTLSTIVGVSELCGRLLDETGYEEYVSALPGGRLRRGNLEALLARAQAYEQSEARSLSSFIKFMDRIESTDTMGAATALGADVVRVLSAHKSKGLEFPVVIVAGLGKQFNRSERAQDMAMENELGLGIRVRRGNQRFDTLARRVILDANADATLEEELRILYVAMTRAREKLVMLLSTKDAAAAVQKHARRLTGALCATARCEGDWLLWAILNTPSGNALRSFADLPPLGGSGEMECRVAGVSASGAEIDFEKEFRDFEENARLAGTDEWQKRLSWSYPHLADTQIPGKMSVSELIGNYPSMRAYPDFIAARKSIGAADRGTATHLVMETIPLCAQTRESVQAHLASLVGRAQMTQAQADAVDVDAVLEFWGSPIGQRILKSERVERERQFNYRVSARKALCADTDEPMLLQGVIDCCFMEDGEWVVLDYKTDRVRPGDTPEQTAQKHKRQLDIYSDALSALSGERVKARYIHLLSVGKTVEI